MFVLADRDGKVDFLFVNVLVDVDTVDVEPGTKVEKLIVDVDKLSVIVDVTAVVLVLVLDLYGVGDIVEGILDDEEALLDDGAADGDVISLEVVVVDEDELDNEEVMSEV